jgi:cardiolipin synthase
LPDDRATSKTSEDTRRQLRRSLECLVGVHFTEGNAVTVLRNGAEIFPAMLEAIRNAQHTVDLMTFVYWKGWPAQQFADALCDRARAGLRVRVLIDALGGIQIQDGIVEAMKDSGVDVHWYRKPWLNSPFKQNHRGHRKVCIIDETIGFLLSSSVRRFSILTYVISGLSARYLREGGRSRVADENPTKSPPQNL